MNYQSRLKENTIKLKPERKPSVSYISIKRKINDAMDAGNFKLAIKLWKRAYAFAKSDNNKWGIISLRKVRKIIKRRYWYDKGFSFIEKANRERNKKNYNSAIVFYGKARDYLIKSDFLKRRNKKSTLKSIDYQIEKIRLKIHV